MKLHVYVPLSWVLLALGGFALIPFMAYAVLFGGGGGGVERPASPEVPIVAPSCDGTLSSVGGGQFVCEREGAAMTDAGCWTAETLNTLTGSWICPDRVAR
jgi:hypothetical protein